ncbi:MAG: C40 family peptidase [Magnetococcales bacterium]|nr:C40 family peptidase [Magnetococcales bacterium]
MTDHWVLDFLGRPWVPGADGPCAYDCWGLVRAVYRYRYSIDLPVIPADAESILSIKSAIADGVRIVKWESIPSPCEGAVLLMSHGKIPHHVGVVVMVCGQPHVLHAVEGSGVVIQDLVSLKLHGWNVREICKVLEDAGNHPSQ